MKKVILTALLGSIITIGLQATNLEGKYRNNYLDVTLRLEHTWDGIKVKGKWYSGWKHFYRERRGVFKRNNGDVIRFNDASSFEYFDRSKRRSSQFHKNSYDRYDQRDRYNRYDNYDNRSRNSDRLRRNNNYRDRISGTWYSTKGSLKAYVEFNGQGLRARRTYNQPWVYYRQNSSEPNVFRDDRGNKYILGNDQKLIWLSANGADTIRFVK